MLLLLLLLLLLFLMFLKDVSCLQLHLFDQKYSKTCNIVKYYNDLNNHFLWFCDGKAEF